MLDEPVPYQPTVQAQLLGARARIEELEHILRHFDRSSLNLYLYIQSIEGLPDAASWQLVREQVDEMVDPYGPRNFSR